MSISSLQLDAFMEVVRLGSFSAAAKSLHVTQSALSQRILNLERELEAPVMIRGEKELKMTATGEKLWDYGRGRDELEKEFFSDVSSKEGEIVGSVHIGSFSTYTRSVLLPEIAKIKKLQPSISFNVETREIRELPTLLRSGVYDFVFSTEPVKKQNIVSVKVGNEQNVLIESVSKKTGDTFIDHDENDQTTSKFWEIQKKKAPDYERLFFDEIYTIIDAVALGFGKAVVPKHLAEKDMRVKIVSGLKPLETKVYLCYHNQPISTKMSRFLIEHFT
ncbi:LysR family transcriptional regulator [bacterium]|nr:LysR family transcriptional regulator [bacterium]